MEIQYVSLYCITVQNTVVQLMIPGNAGCSRGRQLTKSYQVNVLKHKTFTANSKHVYEIISSTSLIGIKAFTPEEPVCSAAEIYGHIRAPPIDHWIHHGEKCDNKVLVCCFSLLYNRARDVSYGPLIVVC